MIRPKAKLPQSNTKVSLLIPARNEEGSIGSCLRSLINQDHQNLEIIVLDDHSTDRTRAIVESQNPKLNSYQANRYQPDGQVRTGHAINCQSKQRGTSSFL